MLSHKDLRKRRCRDIHCQVQAVLGRVGGGGHDRRRSDPGRRRWISTLSCRAIWKAAQGQALPEGQFSFSCIMMDQIYEIFH